MITQKELLYQIDSLFPTLNGNPSVYESFFRVDDKTFSVKSKSKKTHKLVTQALMHLLISSNKEAPVSLTIEVWSGNKEKLSFTKLTNSLLRLQGKNFLFFYNPGFNGSFASFSLYDLKNKRSIFWIEDESKIPWYEIAAPFRTIFHWFFIRNGYELIHGACVANKKQGMLLMGKSGRGKTSTSLTSIITSGLYFIGDDYILLNKSAAKIFCLYSSAKLSNDTLKRFGNLIIGVTLSKETKQKHILFLNNAYKNKILKSTFVKTVAIPEVKHKNKRSIWKPTSSSLPLLEGTTSTIFQSLPHDNKYSFKLLTKLVKKSKTYKLILSEDPLEIGASIKKFLSKNEI